MISDAETIQQTLLAWSAASQLNEATLSAGDDSIIIRLGDVALDAGTKLTIEGDSNRSCEYTAAAIFLQIRDPAQGLIAYRNDCKKNNIPDPIKALDKPVVVSYFVKEFAPPIPADSSDAQPLESAAAPTAAADAADAERKHKEQQKHAREKEKRRHESSKRKSSSGGGTSDHHRSSHGSSSRHREQQSAKKLKKKPDMVTNEQLFEHLNVVADKRGGSNADDLADALTAALSTKGFELSGDPAQLLPHRERTAAILANEIPVGNSASILRANNPRKDLTRVLELYLETVTGSGGKADGPHGKGKGKPPPPPSSSSPAAAKHQAAGNAKLGNAFKPYLVGKKPVIVVPKGMTAPITLVNAHEFLSAGRYVPRDAMLRLNRGGGAAPPPTTFTRTVKTTDLSTGLLEYELVDNPRKLGPNPKEWERIVAVIVLGQSWQFKDWLKQPAYHEPATLFDRVYGFYVSMEGDKVPADVAGWAVRRARLNRDKRGLDSVAAASFWNDLDEWMRVYKAELLPQADH